MAQSSRVAWTIFEGARPLSLSDGTLAVAVPDAGKVAAITQRGHDLRLREALLAVLELDVTIDVIHEGGAGTAPAASSARGPAAAGVGRSPAKATRGSGSTRTGAGPAAPGSQPPAARRSDRPGAVGLAAVEHPPKPTEPQEGSDGRDDQAQPSTQSERVVAGPASRWSRTSSQEIVDEEPDVPSEDDPDVDEVDGLALVTRELGARTINEIDHS